MRDKNQNGILKGCTYRDECQLPLPFIEPNTPLFWNLVFGTWNFSQTGFSDFNARLYRADLGRFMNVDPLATDPSQVSISPYAFAWNDPVGLNDPSGLNPDLLPEVLVTASGSSNQLSSIGLGGVPNTPNISGMITQVGVTGRVNDFMEMDAAMIPAETLNFMYVTAKDLVSNWIFIPFLNDLIGEEPVTRFIAKRLGYDLSSLSEEEVTQLRVHWEWGEPELQNKPNFWRQGLENFQDAVGLGSIYYGGGFRGGGSSGVLMAKTPLSVRYLPSLRGTDNNTWNKLKEIGIEKEVKTAIDKGWAQRRMGQGSTGIIGLSKKELIKYPGYTHKVKLSNHGSSHYRILGNIVKNPKGKNMLVFSEIINE